MRTYFIGFLILIVFGLTGCVTAHRAEISGEPGSETLAFKWERKGINGGMCLNFYVGIAGECEGYVILHGTKNRYSEKEITILNSQRQPYYQSEDAVGTVAIDRDKGVVDVDLKHSVSGRVILQGRYSLKKLPNQLPEPTSGLTPGRGSSLTFGKNYEADRDIQ